MFTYFYRSVTSEINFVRCRNIVKTDLPNHRSRILIIPFFLFWQMVIAKLPYSLYLASTECLCKFDYLKKDNFPHLPSVLECLLKSRSWPLFSKERETPAQICEL